MQTKKTTKRTGRTKGRQVKFYCGEDLFKRLQSEKIREHTTIQVLLTEALELLFESMDVERDTADRPPSIKSHADYAKHGATVYQEFLLMEGERHWLEMWLRFGRELPKETVDAQRQIIQDFLKFFRSSRLKREKGS